MNDAPDVPPLPGLPGSSVSSSSTTSSFVSVKLSAHFCTFRDFGPWDAGKGLASHLFLFFSSRLCLCCNARYLRFAVFVFLFQLSFFCFEAPHLFVVILGFYTFRRGLFLRLATRLLRFFNSLLLGFCPGDVSRYPIRLTYTRQGFFLGLKCLRALTYSSCSG